MIVVAPLRAGLSIAILCASFLAACPAAAQAARPQGHALENFDMATVIRAAANRKAGTMKVGIAQATHRVDDMLVSDYGARGRIGGEANARLKSLYTQAAHLLMNGYPIAGGTLVVIARQEPAYTRSAVGAPFSAFVGGMLSPVEDDDVLAKFAARANRARAVLSKLAPELQMAAQLRVMGAIYNDEVAVDAGTAALRQQQASPADMALVTAALKAGGAQ